MGKGKIDLGISTEEKPEWTISLDFDANNVVKDDLEEQSVGQDKPKGSGSIFNDALDSDFLSDDRSFFSDAQNSGRNSTGIAGGLDETIQSPGAESSFGNTGSSDSILGAVDGSIPIGADDSLTTISTGADTSFENEVFIGSQERSEEKKEPASSKVYVDQSAKVVQEVVDQFSASMQAVVEQLSASVHAEQSNKEPEQPLDHLSQMQEEKEEPAGIIEEPAVEPEQPLDHLSQMQEEKEEPAGIIEEPAVEPVLEVINEHKEEIPGRERDEVEEQLTHLANSVDPWEQSENALSEAAAMLSKEGKNLAVGVNSEEKELKDLFERLDISENLDRMNAVAQEDMADVIEQTQKDNELVEAIDVRTIGQADTISEEPKPEPEAEPVAAPQPQKEETISPGEMEITNDMFDMGYDLSDEEENYSDENIDLDSFKGSIEDADEFSSSENSLDLDEAEHTGQNGAQLDMSNLVAAAMSGLNGSYGDVNIQEPEESVLSEAEFVSEEDTGNTLDLAMPEENSALSETEFISEEDAGNTLDLAMPEESVLSEAEFVSEEDTGNTLDFAMPEENSVLSETEFISGGEDTGNTLDLAMPEENNVLSETEFISEEDAGNTLDFAMPEENSALSETEFISGGEESALQETPAEYRDELPSLEEEPVEEEAAPEEIKLEFEPVYPEGQGPDLTGILDDTEDGDVASMIIEDYSEVPTVSDIETKLKKKEKEKKKNKSKESQQNKTDGFAYSLDDINTKTVEDIEPPEEKTLVGRAAVEAALEVAAETAAAAGEVPRYVESSEEFTASVYARHVVHKEGKIKRSYYSLFYK